MAGRHLGTGERDGLEGEGLFGKLRRVTHNYRGQNAGVVWVSQRRVACSATAGCGLPYGTVAAELYYAPLVRLEFGIGLETPRADGAALSRALPRSTKPVGKRIAWFDLPGLSRRGGVKEMGLVVIEMGLVVLDLTWRLRCGLFDHRFKTSLPFFSITASPPPCVPFSFPANHPYRCAPLPPNLLCPVFVILHPWFLPPPHLPPYTLTRRANKQSPHWHPTHTHTGPLPASCRPATTCRSSRHPPCRRRP
jgi:hypothetical protein